jgi:hypothetical protein
MPVLTGNLTPQRGKNSRYLYFMPTKGVAYPQLQESISAHSWRSNAHWLACLALPLLWPEYKYTGFWHARSVIGQSQLCLQEKHQVYKQLCQIPAALPTLGSYCSDSGLLAPPCHSTNLHCQLGSPLSLVCYHGSPIWLPPTHEHPAAHKVDWPGTRPLWAHFNFTSLVVVQNRPFQGDVIASPPQRRHNVTTATSPG